MLMYRPAHVCMLNCSHDTYPLPTHIKSSDFLLHTVIIAESGKWVFQAKDWRLLLIGKCHAVCY